MLHPPRTLQEADWWVGYLDPAVAGKRVASVVGQTTLESWPYLTEALAVAALRTVGDVGIPLWAAAIHQRVPPGDLRTRLRAHLSLHGHGLGDGDAEGDPPQNIPETRTTVGRSRG